MYMHHNHSLVFHNKP